MKKFLFSRYTKTFAVILFLASLTLGALVGIHGVQLLWDEQNYIYDFGTSLEDSWYFRHLVSLPENTVMGTLHEFFYWNPTEDSEAITEETFHTSPTVSFNSTIFSEEDWTRIYRRIGERLENLPYLEYIEYYVNLNGTVFSNGGVTDGAALENGVFYSFYRDKNGSEGSDRGEGSYTSGGFYDYGMEGLQVESLTIVTRIRPEHVESCSLLWKKHEQIIYHTSAQVLICILVLLLSLVYLICVCGKDTTGNRKEWWIDRIWAEIHLGFMIAFALGGTLLCAVIIESAFDKQLPIDTAYLLPGLIIPFAGSLILCSLLSMIRNLKAGLFAKRCGILIIVKWIFRLLWSLCKALRRGICRFRQSFVNLRGAPLIIYRIGILVAYTVLVFIFAVLMTEEGIFFGFLILLFAAGAFFFIQEGKDLHHIKTGAEQIRKGDLSHEIPTPKTPHLKSLGDDVNQIAKGLDASLAARMKAERMKTELITNVSHDLKTPLTSIINYAELLSRVEDLPEEAGDYIRIIGEKSQRLKSLTQDLFDMSKVQSGNEEVQWEVLDAALLLEQSLAEEIGDYKDIPLQFLVKAEENLSFMGDGRKLSRVLGNLIRNARNYAMAGTRVFLSAYETEGRVIIECKNTSAYPLDFTPEEILGRFVRGDSSRSTEGNGLGLPIAKSYTELCGGDFRLILDGDLFKVLLSFSKSK